MFRIGQKVVYIGDDGRGAPFGNYVALGVVYIVRSTFTCPALNEAGIRLDGVQLPHSPKWGAEYGFPAVYFRPVVEKKTDISVFTEILRRETVDDRAPART